MDIFGILDPDPHENFCGSETLEKKCRLAGKPYLAGGGMTDMSRLRSDRDSRVVSLPVLHQPATIINTQHKNTKPHQQLGFRTSTQTDNLFSQ